MHEHDDGRDASEMHLIASSRRAARTRCTSATDRRQEDEPGSEKTAGSIESNIADSEVRASRASGSSECSDPATAVLHNKLTTTNSTIVPTTMNITYCRRRPVCTARSDRPRSQVQSANVSTMPSTIERSTDDVDTPRQCRGRSRRAQWMNRRRSPCGRTPRDRCDSNSVGRTNTTSYSSSNYHLFHSSVVERLERAGVISAGSSIRHR